jgi:hypothetical protein
MKKLSKLTAALLLLASASPALKAEDVVEYNYSEGFEVSNSSTQLSSAIANSLEGWSAITDEWYPTGVSYSSSLKYVFKAASSDYWDSFATHGGSYAMGTTGKHALTYGWNDALQEHTADDYVVSPQVEGTISLYAIRYNASDSYPPVVKIYDIIDDGEGNLSVGDCLADFSETLQAVTDKTTWTKLSFDLPEGEYHRLGLWLDYVYIDDFSATSAIMPAKRAVSLSAWGFRDGQSANVIQNADGTVPVAGYVQLTNTGNVTLKASDSDCYLQIVRSSYESVPLTDNIPLPADVAPGETVDIDYSGTIDLPEGLTINSSFVYRVGLKWKELITSSVSTAAWFEISPGTAVMSVKYDSSNYSSSKAIDYGINQGSSSKTFEILNRGGADLVINGVTCPTGVSVELPEGYSYPLTVAVGESVDINVTMASEKTISVNGKVVFDVADGTVVIDSDNNATNEIAVAGAIVSPDSYYEGFDNGVLPSGWYNESGSAWSVSAHKTGQYSSDGYNLYNSTQMSSGTGDEYTGTGIVSPKLHFDEGESINFYLNRANYNTNTNGLSLYVYYSTDRSDWNLLGRVVTSSEMQTKYPDALVLSAQTYSTQYNFTGFSMDMPQGDYYIRFEAGYVYIDDIFGGKLVDVDYDIMAGNIAVGKTTTVNNALELSASFSNLIDKALAEDSYTVKFYENGKQVGAVPASPEFGNGTTTYSTVYYPHTAGEVTLSAVMALNDGENEWSAPEQAVKIAVETASEECQIGTVTGNNSNVPLKYNYCNSRSETVYTAEELGLTAGAVITQIAYPYYCTADQTVLSEVNIWLENTEDESVGSAFTDTNNMTQVYANANYPDLEKIGSSSNLEGRATYTLSEGFEYTGGSLRVVIESLSDSYKSIGFGKDANQTKTVLYKYNDSRSTYENASASTVSCFPVIILSTAKTVTPNKGVVKDAEGNLIEGAAVKAEYPVDDVNSIYYEATTNADGEFEFTIYRTDVEGDYNLAVNAAGYETANTTVAPADQETVVVLNKAASLYPETLYLYGTYYVNGEVRQWDMNNAIALIKDEENDGLFSVSGINFDNTVEETAAVESDEEGDGNTTIGGVTPSAKYAYFAFCENASATAPGRTYGATEPRLELTKSGEYTLEAGTNLFRISPATCDLTVDLAAGTLTIKIYSATDGLNTISTDLTAGPVDVYNLQGVLLRRGVDRAAATTGLPRGIYIVGGRKALVK